MPGLAGMGIGMHQQAGRRWAEETVALLARMTVAPDGARALLINELVSALKQAGVWSRLDAFYMLAAHHQQAARRNWVADLYNLSPTNAPSFEIDRGYTGNGSAHLDTGFNPATSGMYALTDAHMGVYCLSNVAEDVGDCGNVNARIFSRTLGNRISGRMNDAVAPSMLAITTSSVGHTVFSRHASGGYRIEKNGETVANPTNSADALTSANFLVLAAGPGFSTKQVAAVHFGRSLTPAQSAALATAVQTYLNGVGA